MKQYKVLHVKIRGLSFGPNASKLEEELNAYAQRGWRLVSSVSGGEHGICEIIAIMERDA